MTVNLDSIDEIEAAVSQIRMEQQIEQPPPVPAQYVAQTKSPPLYTREQIELIKRTICPKDASDDELKMFLMQCARTQLDPFARQINAIRRGGKFSIEVAIDGFRLLSERSGKYAGMVGPYWCGDDEVWKDVWLSPEPPAAARVGILRTDFKEPVWGVALYDEYKVVTNHMWHSMPANQLSIVAEKKARRIAFPYELSGLYGDLEMEQAGGSAPAPKQPLWPDEGPIKRDEDLTPKLEASLAEARNSKPHGHFNEEEACDCGSPLMWKTITKAGVSKGYWFCQLYDNATRYDYKVKAGKSFTEEERWAREQVNKLQEDGVIHESLHVKFKAKKGRGE